MIKRRVTKPLFVGDVKIGGDAPVSVQSMTKTDTRDVAATVRQIRQLEDAGCEIIRSAVPDMQAAEALADIKRQINIPLVADIHFHYQLALQALESGVDCLRLNPRKHPRPRKGRTRRPRGEGARSTHTHRRQLRKPAPGRRHRQNARPLPPQGRRERPGEGRRRRRRVLRR